MGRQQSRLSALYILYAKAIRSHEAYQRGIWRQPRTKDFRLKAISEEGRSKFLRGTIQPGVFGFGIRRPLQCVGLN